MEMLKALLPVDQKVNVGTLISEIGKMGFEWGVGDGN